MKIQSRIFNRDYKVAKLTKLAKTGKYSAPRLAKIFNCNKKAIFRALEEIEVCLPNLGRFKKKIYCDEKFFINICPVSAYWAGFIAADGCLSDREKGVTIRLNKRDTGHLRKFITAIKTNAKISFVKSNNSAGISVYSKALFESLVRLGITPNKSLTIFSVKCPLRLQSHFIRGVFEGDGWISGKKVTHIQLGIAGNKPFLQHIQNTLMRNCDISKTKLYPLSHTGRAYKLQYTGQQIFKILDFLYKDSSDQIRLDRKYQKALGFKGNFKNN